MFKVCPILIAGLLGMAVSACQDGKKAESPPPRVSPGPPRHWDIGDRILRTPLPQDVSDGYLEFGRSPASSYGVMLAHERISARSHERSDMVFYVHGGVARIHVGPESFTASTGDAVYIPRGAIYSAESLSRRSIELFAIFTPPLDAADIVYVEASDRSEPGPGGKRKLRVEIDTAAVKRAVEDTTGRKFLEWQEEEEIDE
ncbi:MAG: cupin domain-containing protein [Calditrichaeota bacterium]|nr:cupin domain-containing protein [Calditrichota bacterium]